MHYVGTKPKNTKFYHVEFVVVGSDRATPILGNKTMQQMDLVRAQHSNVSQHQLSLPHC